MIKTSMLSSYECKDCEALFSSRPLRYVNEVPELPPCPACGGALHGLDFLANEVVEFLVERGERVITHDDGIARRIQYDYEAELHRAAESEIDDWDLDGRSHEDMVAQVMTHHGVKRGTISH